MNIQLSNTEEFIDGKSTGSLGQVLIRCVLAFRLGWGFEIWDLGGGDGRGGVDTTALMMCGVW